MSSRAKEHEAWNLEHKLQAGEHLPLVCPRCARPHVETLTNDPSQPDYLHHVHQCTYCGLRFDLFVRTRSTHTSVVKICPCQTKVDDPGPHIPECPFSDIEYEPGKTPSEYVAWGEFRATREIGMWLESSEDPVRRSIAAEMKAGKQKEPRYPVVPCDCSPKKRCDWCGWPIKARVEDGCTVESCSQRPMPTKRTHCAECGGSLP